MPATDTKHQRDRQVLQRFIDVFCRENHGPREGLCVHCAGLLAYALQRLDACPMDPKPKCRDCPVHCYKPEHRQRIREVMKFSGIYFVKRGRVDWLIKYFMR